jgi:predicted nuclease with TOPRIM domain
MNVIQRSEWTGKVPRPCPSIFENLPEASEELVNAESELDNECRRLSKAIKRWKRSDLAPEMDLHLRRLLKDLAEHWSTLEGLYELVESMLFEKARLEEEIGKARELIFALVGHP